MTMPTSGCCSLSTGLVDDWDERYLSLSLSLSLSLPPSHSLERYRVNNNLAAELSKTYTQGWLWWDFELLIISRAAIIIFIFAPDGKNRILELFICLESVVGRAPLYGNCLQSMLALIWSESGHWPCWLILKLTLLTPLGSHRVKSFPLVPPPVRVSTTEPSQPGLVGI